MEKVEKMEEVTLSKTEIRYVNKKLKALSEKFNTYFSFAPYEPVPSIIFIASNYIVNDHLIFQRIIQKNGIRTGIREELNVLNNIWDLEYDDLL